MSYFFCLLQHFKPVINSLFCWRNIQNVTPPPKRQPLRKGDNLGSKANGLRGPPRERNRDIGQKIKNWSSREALPGRRGGVHVTCLNFKTSRVGVYKCLSLIVGFAVTVAIWPREVVSCRDFILRAVATFWAMSLVRIYSCKASLKETNLNNAGHNLFHP